MVRFERILYPSDFSEYSAAAAPYACELAEKLHAELHVLHVLESQAISSQLFDAGYGTPLQTRESRIAAEGELARLLDSQWEARNRVVRAAVDGVPFVEIIRYAKERDVDMIVMATHGRSGLSHVLIGSVADRVVRKAPCPVLTIRPEGHEFSMP